VFIETPEGWNPSLGPNRKYAKYFWNRWWLEPSATALKMDIFVENQQIVTFISLAVKKHIGMRFVATIQSKHDPFWQKKSFGRMEIKGLEVGILDTFFLLVCESVRVQNWSNFF
jgi:hypothetical protein